MADTASSASGAGAYWRGALLLAFGLTAVRLTALFVTPLELYPDEAQYWLWSRTLDWGYFSKPPMIAWTIWTTTAIGGNSEAWVRLAAPFYHLGVTLAVFGIGRRLYGPAIGFAACALYALMPGVQISSLAIATDAALLFFLSLSLLAYVELPLAQGRRRLLTAAGFGAAVGLAFLSKYAAVYALIGLALHLLISADARRVWDWKTAGVALGAFLLILSPNLAWNAAHGFSTVQHTAANAAWGGRKLFNLPELGEFLVSQFGVFGPIPFAVLMGGLVLLAARRRLTDADLTLLCFSIPPFLIVTTQAFISRANANWSGAGYVAGSILVAAWLMRWRAKGWLLGAVASQAVIATLFLACVISPAFSEKIGAANAFKRAKGWEQTVDAITARAGAERGLTAVAVDDRFLFNASAYYGRDFFGAVNAPPLKMWVREAHAQNQAETTDPLTPATGARVLAASLDLIYRDELAQDFQAVSGREIHSVMLDAKRRRRTELFIGEGYAPLPRDPVTGQPPKPKSAARD
ncbi:MAG: glycosyltransferase family 39 protein [Phenylobacterium sp.]|uniref:ArnT family glycosyltransferase n=1 Tax=Phenylobacterium sp. TaxID=1871053 RepID=UPI00273204E2|nr:glycosyltransferase family 39 protein [Phenylobacterium sp.]MDP2011757.1 glycosyltransferase family 39 protein [Phenylobacterium sp.]